ncbi:hypothetical protein V2H45_05065 [Tumidithrix elongata RA019]|uniref:Uncharacterized protein n=1 Tax=Tumidithrix elongata BACA0141 TaxID=2716417 RepID=A0AAW9PYQ2_9CYAN|nr:hypothetical protein [Tumidithrix elongata RA019]
MSFLKIGAFQFSDRTLRELVIFNEKKAIASSLSSDDTPVARAGGS